MNKNTKLHCPLCDMKGHKVDGKPQCQSYRFASEDGNYHLGTIVRFQCSNGHNFYIDEPENFPFLGEEDLEEDEK